MTNSATLTNKFIKEQGIDLNIKKGLSPSDFYETKKKDRFAAIENMLKSGKVFFSKLSINNILK